MTGAAAAVAAQAKVNLFLHVLAREESGYHQVETLYCRLALADDVIVRVAPRGRLLDCDTADAGPAELNLAYRAAVAYSDARGWPPGFTVEITKRIPIGAGLGGGSADAGAVLRALRALDPAPPSRSVLLGWAQALGADVPALTIEQPLTLGWGRGERLLPLPALPARDVMLYVPAVRVATRDAYGWWDAWSASGPAGGRGASGSSPRALELAHLGSWDTLAPLMVNDFEAPVTAHYPEIGGVAAQMRVLPGSYAAVMSGSGSTVFCVLRDHAATPWPIAAPPGGAFVATSTAPHVVGVRRIE